MHSRKIAQSVHELHFIPTTHGTLLNGFSIKVVVFFVLDVFVVVLAVLVEVFGVNMIIGLDVVVFTVLGGCVFALVVVLLVVVAQTNAVHSTVSVCVLDDPPQPVLSALLYLHVLSKRQY